ncbi:MAG: anti-sigma factor [Acidobacteria bacterium]|nr:anti-sigma factor [Acidobacteriota bacterium]
MKDDNSTIALQELAALYALGALCQHEARAFENHLHDGDGQAIAELEAFTQVVEALGYAASSVEPPAYLLDVLTARLHKEPQLPASVLPFPHQLQAPPQSLHEVPHFPPSTAAPMPTNVTSFAAAKSKSSAANTFIPWALAASFLIAAVFGFWQWKKVKDEAAVLNSQMAAVKKETERLSQQLNEENDKVFEQTRISQALRSPNARVVDLRGQEIAPTTQATIFWDTQANQWVVAADLQPAPEGKVYQLWFVTAEAKISAGLIKPKPSGHAFTVISLPKDINHLAAAAITLEPEGGSAQPTSPIYTFGKIAG